MVYHLFEIWVLFIISLNQIETVTGQTGAQAKALRTKLFVTDGYDFRVRPINAQNKSVNVTVDFSLLAINALDEVSETLKTTGFLQVVWKDEFLTWNITDWGNIDVSYWPQNEVWKPDIAMSNSYKDYKQLGVSSLNVEVFADGTVKWKPFQVFESTCSIDISHFPFDEQICSLVFVSWSYTILQVYVSGGLSGIDMEDYEGNSQWHVADTWWSNFEDDSESSITFFIKIKRKPMYSILTMIFPVILLAVLNILVFTIPCESGEKAGYAITVFLSFAVFLTIIESSFPKNSETVAYFAIYVITQTAQSTVITFLSLLMIKCSYFDDSVPIPKLIIVFAKLGHFKCDNIKCKVRKHNEVHQMKADDHAQKAKALNEGTGVDDSCNDLKKDDQTIDEAYTWRWAMRGLDNLLLIVFTCILILVAMRCILGSYYGK